MSDWDYIIIGAGSSGCAVAHELASAGKAVLLLEAGGSDRSPYIKFYAGLFLAGKRFDWGYQCEPDPSRNGAQESWARGRVLGGSSSVNGTIYVRGGSDDFDRWSRFCGGEGRWSAEDVFHLYRELECSDQDNTYRGKEGPVFVRTKGRAHDLTKAFIQSVIAAGFPYNEDYNGRTQEGVSYIQYTQRKGLRWSAADAFLRPVIGLKNLKLILGAQVEKIHICHNRAVGITFRRGGRTHHEGARHIILSAGAINSPQLLMLSGVGDPGELGRHGIESVRALPGVGRNLQEHPCLRFIYRTKIHSNNLTGGLLQRLSISAEFLLHREGPLAGIFESTAFLKTAPTESAPDVQLTFSPLAYLGKYGVSIKLAPYPACAIMVNKSHAKSRGQIRLRSQDPTEPPVIDCRLLEDPGDLETLARSFDLVRRIASTQPLAELLEAEAVPGPNVRSGEEIRQYIREHTEITFHPVGTCRMGVDDSAVVNPDFTVRGIENLFIADASIIPDLPRGNTNAVCMLIGAKLGRLLSRDSRRIVRRY